MARIIRTAGLVVVLERKLLLAFSCNKQAWYLPGGKKEPGETDLQTLIREVREELDIALQPEDLNFYHQVLAPAFGETEDTMMEQQCYVTRLRQQARPMAEIAEIGYFSRLDYRLQPRQVPGVLVILERLFQDKMID